MTDYLDLPIGNESPEIVTAVIEIPQGCINKYEYDTAHVLYLDYRMGAVDGRFPPFLWQLIGSALFTEVYWIPDYLH